MSLLANLSLGYEFLADDPIEVGIHYGQSLLQFVSSKIQTAVPSTYPPSPFADQFVPSRGYNVQRKAVVRPSVPAVEQREAAPIKVERTQALTDTNRSIAARQPYSFSLRQRNAPRIQRTFIGVI